MTEQELIQAARGVTEAFSASDWEAWKAAMTPSSVYDEVGTSRRLGGGISQCWQGRKEAMPDTTGVATNACATGNIVVIEVMRKRAHAGPLQGPSGTAPATTANEAGQLSLKLRGWKDQEKPTLLRHAFLHAAVGPIVAVVSARRQQVRWKCSPPSVISPPMRS